jgi:hypothetical protein
MCPETRIGLHIVPIILATLTKSWTGQQIWVKLPHLLKINSVVLELLYVDRQRYVEDNRHTFATLCHKDTRLTFILLMWRIGWAPNSIPIYIWQDATLHSLFISGNCSACFGWYFHPSSGAHIPVSTASTAYATHSTLKPVPTHSGR